MKKKEKERANEHCLERVFRFADRYLTVVLSRLLETMNTMIGSRVDIIVARIKRISFGDGRDRVLELNSLCTFYDTFGLQTSRNYIRRSAGLRI